MWTLVAVFVLLLGGTVFAAWFLLRTPATGLPGMIERVAAAGDPSSSIIAVDVAAAKEAAEIPDDADLASSDASDRAAQAQLDAALIPLRNQHGARPDAATASIDLSQIALIASSGPAPERSITLIDTDQDPEEIASAFVSTGDYSRSGDAVEYTGEAGPDVRYTRIAWANGLVALTADPGASDAFLTDALTKEPEETDRFRVANTVRRNATGVYVSPVPDGGCVAYSAAAERFNGESALVLVTREGVDASSVTADLEQTGLLDRFAPTEATIAGRMAQLPFEAEAPDDNLFADFPEIAPYWSCG